MKRMGCYILSLLLFLSLPITASLAGYTTQVISTPTISASNLIMTGAGHFMWQENDQVIMWNGASSQLLSTIDVDGKLIAAHSSVDGGGYYFVTRTVVPQPDGSYTHILKRYSPVGSVMLSELNVVYSNTVVHNDVKINSLGSVVWTEKGDTISGNYTFTISMFDGIQTINLIPRGVVSSGDYVSKSLQLNNVGHVAWILEARVYMVSGGIESTVPGFFNVRAIRLSDGDELYLYDDSFLQIYRHNIVSQQLTLINSVEAGSVLIAPNGTALYNSTSFGYDFIYVNEAGARNTTQDVSEYQYHGGLSHGDFAADNGTFVIHYTHNDAFNGFSQDRFAMIIDGVFTTVPTLSNVQNHIELPTINSSNQIAWVRYDNSGSVRLFDGETTHDLGGVYFTMTSNGVRLNDAGDVAWIEILDYFTGGYTANVVLARAEAVPDPLSDLQAAFDILNDPLQIDPTLDTANKKSISNLSSLINEVTSYIDLSDIVTAQDILTNDLIPKLDGCALRGTPDTKGWEERDQLVTCSAQHLIYPLLISAQSQL